jgi:hypothetical protein
LHFSKAKKKAKKKGNGTMKSRLFLFLLLLGSSSLWSPVWAEQTCDTKSFPMSSPVERFTDNGDGTLYDIEPDLTWMRCSLGQVWNGTTCTGTPATYNWKSAQDAASKLNREGGYANHRDWHVPQIRELASIIERQCFNPRINLKLFPGTPAAYFWTTTMRPGSAKEDPFAYAISFGSEGPVHMNKEKMLYVRLVSGGAPK